MTPASEPTCCFTTVPDREHNINCQLEEPMPSDPLHDEDGEQPAEYGLVMPFVVTDSEGGPYNAKAFVAGYSASNLDETLRHLAHLHTNGLTSATVERYVPPELVPQLDLIAMRHGFTLTSEPWDEHPDEWTLATFTLGQGGSDGT